MYEARHKLLNLPTKSIVEAEIPASYFSPVEQEFSTSDLVKSLSSVPNSPLTPGTLLQNFTPTFPNASFQNQLSNRVHDFPNLTPENIRYHQALQQQLASQNIASNLATNFNPSYPYSPVHPSVSPRSTSTNTSGYLSHSSKIFNFNGSANSLEQLYAPYKPAVQIIGPGVNHFPHAENQAFVGNSANNLSRHLNESGGTHPFETENHLLTPNYHSVRIKEKK